MLGGVAELAGAVLWRVAAAFRLVVRNLLAHRHCSWTEESGDELEIGGFRDSKANLELHDVWWDGILVFAQRGEQDLIQRKSACLG